MGDFLDRDGEFIYHYCSSSTFLSIIQHRKVWLTDLTLSNDSMEGLWAAQSYLDGFNSDDSRGRIAAKEALEMEIRARVALGSCFSSGKDLLSQWRGYATGGRGVCIGFRVDELKTVGRKTGGADLPVKLEKISYRDSLPPDLTKRIWEEFKPQIEEGRKGKGDISFGKDYSNGGHDRATNLISELFTVKNPAFQEEKEWRLLLVDYPTKIPEMKFRENNSLLTPYLELQITDDMIASVRLGPANPTPERDIEKLLSAYKIDATVWKSSATFIVR